MKSILLIVISLMSLGVAAISSIGVFFSLLVVFAIGFVALRGKYFLTLILLIISTINLFITSAPASNWKVGKYEKSFSGSPPENWPKVQGPTNALSINFLDMIIISLIPYGFAIGCTVFSLVKARNAKLNNSQKRDI